MLFSLLFIKYLHYTKYPIDVQHFYSNRYITDCGIAICRCRSRARRPSLFVRTDKQAPTDQGLQAHCCITNSCVAVCCCGPGDGSSLSEQTSKHPVNKGFQSLPHSYIMRTSRCGPWTPWETFVRTDKQAVIHRLFTVYGKVIHSFAP